MAEPILLTLADQATPAEVARAGRYLHDVLNPDGADDDAETDYRQRFLQVRESATGGLEGEFRLPREAAARLRTLLDAYAKPREQGDDRPLRVRNADAFIALLEQQISTELLILVNAESLPDDPHPTHPTSPHPNPPRPGPHLRRRRGPDPNSDDADVEDPGPDAAGASCEDPPETRVPETGTSQPPACPRPIGHEASTRDESVTPAPRRGAPPAQRSTVLRPEAEDARRTRDPGRGRRSGHPRR